MVKEESKQEMFEQIIKNQIGYVVDVEKSSLNECPIIDVKDGIITLSGYYNFDYKKSIMDLGDGLFLTVDEAEEYLFAIGCFDYYVNKQENK